MSGCAALGGLGGAEDKDNELVCPVCFDLIREAYVTRCGHSFCHSCVSRVLEHQRRCPKCGAPLPSREHIFPNLLLNELVAKRRARMGTGAATGGGGGAELRAMLAAEAARLPLYDVDSMLEMLSRRKRMLQADGAAAAARLLREFLATLLRDREQRATQLAREAGLVKKDLEHVDKLLMELRTSAAPGEEPSDCLADLADFSEAPEAASSTASNDVGAAMSAAGSSGAALSTATGEERFAGGAGGESLAARWRRVTAHFDDFVQCYLGHRADELYFPPPESPSPAVAAPTDPPLNEDAAHVPLSRSQSTQGPDPHSGLEAFSQDLAAFTRFRALRPLATLSYCSDAINYSTIVSTIEFDKDLELFAIAGVTKRIKVFEYASVIRDAVDVHYPSAEMSCAHKVSSVSWNHYHKHVLASADYEGGVALWDVSSATRTRALHEHDKRVWSVHFSRADVRLLASGSDDARVKLWALNAERSVATLDARFNVCCVRFNPKSAAHLAFGCADHCVHYYDLRAPRAPLAVLKDHRKAVSYVKFVDSRTLVSASTDSQLKLWSVDSPRCLRSFTGHANEKNFVGLATDGKYIACGSENNALYVYYKGLSRPLVSYKFEAVRGFLERERRDDEPSEFVSAVCWRRAHDSNVLLAANSQGTIKVLELI